MKSQKHINITSKDFSKSIENSNSENSVIWKIAHNMGDWIKGDDNIHCFEFRLHGNVFSMTIDEDENSVLWIGEHNSSDVNNHEIIKTIFTGKAHVRQSEGCEDTYWINFDERHDIRIVFHDCMDVILYRDQNPVQLFSRFFKE